MSFSTVTARIKQMRAGDQLVRRPPLIYSRALQLYESLEQASLDERVRWTDNRLAQILKRARRTPYGRVHGGEHIDDWPLLDKEQVRSSPDIYCSRRSVLGVEASTSGSTGMPIDLRRSFFSLTFEQAAIDRLLLSCGISLRHHRAAVLRGDDIKDPSDQSPPFWRRVAGGRRLVLSANHLNRRTVRSFADALEDFAPDVLHAYPSALESLCMELHAVGRSLTIPLTLCSSEVLPPGTWDVVKEALRTHLVDHYGQAERVAFAYARERSVYRFLPGYSYNELLPANESRDGIFEIVGTGLWNLAMPMIRYRTGDLIELGSRADIDEIRFGVGRFNGVIGRDSDYLLSPEGTRLIAVNHIPRGVDRVVRTQVVQDGNEVRICVIPADGFGHSDIEALLSNASRKLPSSMNVGVDIVSELRRDDSGKTPFIIRR